LKLHCLNPACGKQFMYAAKLTTNYTPSAIILNEHITAVAQQEQTPQRTTEYHVCPYCLGLDVDELPEAQEQITSVKSVDLSEVDGWLKQGYTIKELYSKNATLVKTEAKQP